VSLVPISVATYVPSAERLYAEVPPDHPIPRALCAPVARLLRQAAGNE
jgi:type III secretion protein U